MLGLMSATDPRWVDKALANFDAVLLDHFHCELKAASNATSLVSRYPQHARMVRELTAVAREELDHASQVHDELVRRNIALRPPEPDPYAVALRLATKGSPPHLCEGLLDRLAVGALIEARSCERFALLRDRVTSEALRAWYSDLFESEARHYRLFASLAEEIAGQTVARERLAWLAGREAEIVAGLPLVARVH
ncbi:MAG: tRNA-(ms[2]io[6]A)-hydroxylase [Deltaproteobacteria bacterium]